MSPLAKGSTQESDQLKHKGNDSIRPSPSAGDSGVAGNGRKIKTVQTNQEAEAAAGERIRIRRSVETAEKTIAEWDNHLTEGNVTPDLHEKVVARAEQMRDLGADMPIRRSDSPTTVRGQLRRLDLTPGSEDRKMLIEYGRTEEDLDKAIEDGRTFTIKAEFFNGNSGGGGQQGKEVVLYDNADTLDADEEIAHALIDLGYIDEPAGTVTWAQSEAFAKSIADKLDAGASIADVISEMGSAFGKQEVTNVKSKQGGVSEKPAELGKEGKQADLAPGESGLRAEGGAPGSVSTTAAGSGTTAPARTYPEGVDSKGNVWIRQSNTESNAGRQLLVQFSTELINKDFPVDASTRYYDTLYGGQREGYLRLRDFWEIPQWMGYVSNYLPNADVYVVRDMAEAAKFLNEAGYERAVFSAIDVNKEMIKALAKGFKGQVDIGGYTVPGTFDDIPNAKWHPTLDSLAKDVGVPFVEGVNYRHFEGSKVIPRLTMSQGCLHKCAFCTVPKDLVATDLAIVDQQAEAFGTLDAKLVYLNDKTFGQAKNYTHLENVYQTMLNNNPDFKGFIIQTTGTQLNKMDPEWLKRSGIKYVELGVETYNNAILKKLHKPHNEAILDKAAQRLRDADIALIPNIIIGLPGETAETYARTMQFLEKNEDIISHANIYNLALYEGAELAQSLKATTPQDLDENVIEKSFHTDKEIHKGFADKVYAKGQETLEKKAYAIGETDKKYLKAVESGDMATAQRMVDEAAKRAGYNIKGVHNSKDANITVFDISKGELGIHIGTDNTSKNLRRGNDYRVVLAGKYLRLPTDRGSWSEPDVAYDIGDALGWGMEKSDQLYEKSNATPDKATNNVLMRKVLNAAGYNGIVYQNTHEGIRRKGTSEVLSLQQADAIAEGKRYDSAPIMARESPEEFSKTFDADDSYIITDPSQIKSADPVTYDDKGNVIPLFERFNEKSPDIRYSIGELAKYVGKKVKSAFKKNDIAQILLDSAPIQAGPLDGGCRVLARALKRIEPAGKVITLEGYHPKGAGWSGTKGWQPEHYGFEWEGAVIDGHGYAKDIETWATRFAEKENLTVPYRVIDHEKDSSDIPQDAPTEKLLASALEKHFADYSVGVTDKKDKINDPAPVVEKKGRISISKTGKRSLGARILAGMEKPSKNVGPLVSHIAAHLSGESAKEGVIDHRTAGPKENKQVETAITDMLEASVMRHPESLGWYRRDIDRAMNILGQIHPDMDEPSNNLWMRIAIALTSDGNKTMKNIELADKSYRNWKESGSLAIPIAAKRGEAIEENLKWAEFVRSGFESDKEFETWLLGKAHAGEIAGDLVANLKLTWAEAKAAVSGEKLESVVPRAIIFGPKLGAFFTNLSGDFSPVTMDMWFMRTVGRIQGNLMTGDSPEDISAERERLRTAMKGSRRGVRIAGIQPSLFGKFTDEDVDKIAKDISRLSISKAFRDKLSAVKGGDELRSAANQRESHLRGGAPVDAPRSGEQRQWLRERIDGVRAMAKKRGMDYENADIQAAIWIGEKEIYNAYGARATQGDYFSDGANALYEKLYGRPSEFYAGSPGSVGRDLRAGPKQDPFFSIGEKENITKRIFDIVKDSPYGFTIKTSDGSLVTKGYAVAPAKETATTFDALSEDDLRRYIRRFRNVFDKDDRAFIGGWKVDDDKSPDNGKFVLDISYVVDNIGEAVFIAKNGDQDGIYHIDGPDPEKRYSRTDSHPRDLQEGRIFGKEKRAELRGIREFLRGIIQKGGATDRFSIAESGRGEVPERHEKEGSLSGVGLHYSREKITSLDTSYAGTGFRGNEYRRIISGSPNSKRAYIYIHEGQGIKKELGITGTSYEVSFSNFYEADYDPLKIIPTVKTLNEFEQEVMKRGFSGIALRDQGIGVFLGEHNIPVKPATEVPAVRGYRILSPSSQYAIGEALKKSPAPVDDVLPEIMKVDKPMPQILAAAKKLYESWPDAVIGADGKTFLPHNPQEGSHGSRVWHLIRRDVGSDFDPEKARWLPNVLATIQNASRVIEDDRNGNRIYVRAYRNGSRHMVVVEKDGSLAEQSKLKTQFPKNKFSESDITAQDRMKIVWERKAATPAGTSPDTAASMIAGSQQAVFQERKGMLPEEKEFVKTKNQFAASIGEEGKPVEIPDTSETTEEAAAVAGVEKTEEFKQGEIDALYNETAKILGDRRTKKIKKLIRDNTGQTTGTAGNMIEMTEGKALGFALRKAAAAARAAYAAAKKEGYELVKDARAEGRDAVRFARHVERTEAMGKMDILKEKAQEAKDQAVNDAILKTAAKFIAEAERIKAKVALKKYLDGLVKRISKEVGPSVDFRYKEAIEALQAGIDPKMRQPKTLERREATREYLRRHPDAEIPTKLMELLDKKPLNEWSVLDLRNLADEIDRLRHLGALKRKLKLAKAQHEHDKNVEAMTKNILKGKDLERKAEPVVGATIEEGKGKRITTAARAMTLQPARIFDKLDGGKEFRGIVHEKWYSEVNDAENDTLNMMDDVFNKLEKDIEALKIKSKDLAKKRKIKGAEITKDEQLDIYAGWMNEKKKMAVMLGNNITSGMYEDIAANLTPEEKKVVAIGMEVYAKLYDPMRDAYIELTNEDIGSEQNYTPMRRMDVTGDPLDAEIADELLLRRGLKKASMEKGFTISRKNVPEEFQKPIRLGFVETLLSQVPKQIRFIKYAQKIRQLNKFLADKAFRAAVEQQYGREYVEELEKYVARVSNPNIYKAMDGMSLLSQELRHNASIAYLAYNLMTLGNQIPSIFLSLGDAGGYHLIASMMEFAKNPMKMIRMVSEKDPQVRHQRLERELEEIKKNQAGLYQQIREKVGDPGFLGIYWFDRIVRTTAWNAVYQKGLADGLSERDAVRRAGESILRIQEGASPKDISSLYTLGEGYLWFLQFTSQLSKIWSNITYDIPAQARQKKYGKAFMSTVGLVLSALGIWIVSNKRLPDTKEEFADVLIQQVIDSIPLVGKVISASKKGFGDLTPPVLSGAKAAADAAFAKTKKQRVKKAIEGVAVTAGMPYVAAKRAYAVVAEKNLMELTGPQKSKETKDKTRLLKRIESDLREGDREELRKAIQEKKITPEERKKVIDNSRLSESVAKAKKMKVGDLAEEIKGASKSDQRAMRPIFVDKIQRAKTLDKETRKEYLDILRGLGR